MCEAQELSVSQPRLHSRERTSFMVNCILHTVCFSRFSPGQKVVIRSWKTNVSLDFLHDGFI